MKRYMCPHADGERGFVLIVVLWSLGLIAVLAASFAITTRTYIKVTANRIVNARVESYADAGANLAILALIASKSSGVEPGSSVPLNATHYLCRIADDTVLAISIEDEGGKVDLNGATPGLLSALFMGFGADPEYAMILTDRLLDFRRGETDLNVSGTSEHGLSRRKGRLLAVEELEQIIGTGSDFYRRIRPFVTVHSRHSGLDPTAAPVKLLAALSRRESADRDRDGSPIVRERMSRAIPRQYVTPSDQLTYKIRIDALSIAGERFVREALVELPEMRPLHYVLREWQQGERFALASDGFQKGLPRCDRHLNS